MGRNTEMKLTSRCVAGGLGEPSRATTESMRFDAHLLGDIDEEIAQRHFVDAFTGHGPEFAMLVAAAGQKDDDGSDDQISVHVEFSFNRSLNPDLADMAVNPAEEKPASDL